jgi:O-antigen ligase
MFHSLQPHRVAVLTAVLATLVVLPAMMDPINLPKLWVLVFCTSISIFSFLNSKLEVVFEKNRIVFVVCGSFLFSLLLAAFFSDTSLHRTAIGVWGRNNGLLTYACFLILYLIVSLQNSDLPSKFLMKSLVVIGLILGFYGFFQSIGIDPIPWENPYRELLLTLGNSNFGSSILAITALATLIYALNDMKSKQIRFLLLGAFLFQFGVIVAARPIQGIIMVLIGTSIFFGFALSYSQNRKLKTVSIYWWGIQFVLGVCAILALFGKGPMQMLLAANLSSLKDRYYHWIAAVNMFQENILFGVGLDSFGDQYRLYREIEAIQSRGTAMFGTNNAHNTFLQLGATGGIFLLITYLALVLYTGWRSIIALKRSQDKKLVGGLFTIWLVLQLQSLISIDQIGVAVWSWVVGGCLVGISKFNIETKVKHNHVKIATKDKNRKPIIFFTPVLLGGVITIALLPIVINDLNIRQRVIKLVNSSDSAKALENANSLYSEALKSPEPALRIVAIEYLLNVGANDLVLSLAQSNVKNFPNSFEAWHALAVSYEKLGQKQNATTAREMSIKLDPLNQEIKKLLENDRQSN